MRSSSVGRIPRGLLLSFVLVSVGLGQNTQIKVLTDGAALSPAASCLPSSGEPSQVFPRLELGCGRVVEYLGVYDASGDYKAVSKFTPRSRVVNTDLPSFKLESDKSMRPAEVPSFIDLHSRGRTVENFAPPARATKATQGHSVFAALRDDLVTFAYGRAKTIVSPSHLTTDSGGRVIISDPDAAVIHVLDGKRSFRIAGGPGRRLRSPNGVAVDKEDNIYVADSVRGLVEVYDPNGKFLRDIGTLTRDEGLFEYPTGIAIDRANGHLYVLDSPRNLLYMLDLQGNVLKRTGNVASNVSGLMLRSRGSSDEPQPEFAEIHTLQLNHPTEITVAGNEVAILDFAGARIQITDLECNYLRRFATHAASTTEMGLGSDIEGNIYLSNLNGGSIAFYNNHGRKLSSFGRLGDRLGEFKSPKALWVDSTNTIFVADTGHHCVQVFQLNSEGGF